MAVATTPTVGLKKPDDTEFYDIEVPNANSDIIDAEFKRVSTQLEDKLSQDDGALNDKTTVLEAVLSLPVGTSFFAHTGSNIVIAADSPAPGEEMQYFELMDYGNRRTVLAIQYTGVTPKMWTREVYRTAWRQDKWTLFATAMPPQKFTIPFINGLSADEFENVYWKNQFNEVTILCSYKKSGTSDDIQNLTQVTSLPPTYWPSKAVKKPAQVVSGVSEFPGGMMHADVVINTSGAVTVLLPIAIPYRQGSFEVTFVAGGQN